MKIKIPIPSIELQLDLEPTIDEIEKLNEEVKEAVKFVGDSGTSVIGAEQAKVADPDST
jgi:hypothetical protein